MNSVLKEDLVTNLWGKPGVGTVEGWEKITRKDANKVLEWNKSRT